MNKLMALLGGEWIGAGLALALLAAGGGAGWVARGLVEAPRLAAEQVKTAQCVAGREAVRARGAEEAALALNRSSGAVSAALDRLAAQAAARVKANQQFLKEIADAPATDLCGRSAAELAFRRSVQPVKGER